VLRAACCVLRAACCVLRAALQYKQSIIVRRRIDGGYCIDSIHCIDVAIEAF